ncbi:MAG TPA: hypothetical protein VJ865_15550 [Gemmatimonadaceae bacterium]|nr:hypothetical protein [Gemmatimonadaceae bacterium]
MPRAYTLATAALALNVPSKWLDNTLSHYRVQGVVQARQGVARRLPIESLTLIAVALNLIADFEVPLPKALQLASRLTASAGKLTLESGARIEIDLPHITESLLQRLEHAVEVVPLPRRGRPPQKTTGRLD